MTGHWRDRRDPPGARLAGEADQGLTWQRGCRCRPKGSHPYGNADTPLASAVTVHLTRGFQSHTSHSDSAGPFAEAHAFRHPARPGPQTLSLGRLCLQEASLGWSRQDARLLLLRTPLIALCHRCPLDYGIIPTSSPAWGELCYQCHVLFLCCHVHFRISPFSFQARDASFFSVGPERDSWASENGFLCGAQMAPPARHDPSPVIAAAWFPQNQPPLDKHELGCHPLHAGVAVEARASAQGLPARLSEVLSWAPARHPPLVCVSGSPGNGSTEYRSSLPATC